jgi:hypothetical protein
MTIDTKFWGSKCYADGSIDALFTWGVCDGILLRLEILLSLIEEKMGSL